MSLGKPYFQAYYSSWTSSPKSYSTYPKCWSAIVSVFEVVNQYLKHHDFHDLTIYVWWLLMRSDFWSIAKLLMARKSNKNRASEQFWFGYVAETFRIRGKCLGHFVIRTVKYRSALVILSCACMEIYMQKPDSTEPNIVHPKSQALPNACTGANYARLIIKNIF